MGAGKYIVYTFYLLFTRACVCVCSHTNACLDLCGYQRTTSGRQFSPSLMCALVTIIRSRQQVCYNLRMSTRNTIQYNSHVGVLLREKGAGLEGKGENVCLPHGEAAGREGVGGRSLYLKRGHRACTQRPHSTVANDIVRILNRIA